MTQPLRTLMRRGALLVLAGMAAVVVTVSPFATKPASAAVLDFGLGGNSCAIETVGWVICPTVRSIARLADKGFTYINQSSLSVNYDLFGGDSRTFDAWGVMRNIANASFVVVFLIIIYRYLIGQTGGIYSLKRLLPRLLIAVIAVNVSYFLGVILIDISNIIGDAIWNIMKNIYGSGSPVMPLGGSADPLKDGNITKMAAAAMGNPMMVWVLLPPIIAVATTVALISAAAVILIIMREAVIAALILAAPVLIVLYLLPNMERFAGQAMRLFLQLLLLYPIIAVLLGTGQIVSMAAGGWDNQSAPYGGGTMSIVPDIVAAAAAVVPLLGVWFLFKNLSSVMSAAGSRLSASISGRRGGKNDDKARVTGKASAGAAAPKNTSGIGSLIGRRQAFSRNRRRRSLGGSTRTGDMQNPSTSQLSGAAIKPPQNNDALQNALQNDMVDDPTKRSEEAQEALQKGLGADGSPLNSEKNQLGGDSKDSPEINLETATNAAIVAGGSEKEKQKTAKDIFNNLNRGHESKDKDRKFGAGAPITGGAQQASGTAQPTAPTASYRAPSMAQNNNIVSGSAPQQPASIIAVPVQVDGSALLGQQNHAANSTPSTMNQPPISGTEEKAKARAQKYLFDADQDLADAQNKIDVLGHNDSPDEAPHTKPHGDDKKDDS